MSLFPAYSTTKTEDDDDIIVLPSPSISQATSGPSSWLENTSFIPALTDAPRSKSPSARAESPIESFYRSRHKHKKSKKHKRKSHDDSLMLNDYAGKRQKTGKEDEDICFVDKKKEPSFCTMKRLMGPAVPKFSRTHCRPLGWTPAHYKGKLKRRSRYFNTKVAEVVDLTGEEEKDRPSWNHDIQQELKNTTEELNRQVSRDTNDVAAWLKLVRIQPSLLSLAPRNVNKLSAAEKRAVIDKQLAILDRALQSNPASSQLLRERYGLASTVIPADELAADLRKRLDLQPLLLEGWLELARIERSHLASCSIPAVTQVYTKALDAVSARRRREPILHVEATVLALVLAAGQFLQEAGLMEQVWTLLRLYTEPSLPENPDPEIVMEMQTAVNQSAEAWEDQASTLEDELLSSGLPSSEVWLRVERLRESAHFLPAPDCIWAREGDPQRLVFPEDLAQLSQPITQQDLSLRLAVTALLVLGAPPLPSTHVGSSVFAQGVPVTNLGLFATNWPLLCADLMKPAEWLGKVTSEILSGAGLLLTSGQGGRLYRKLLSLTFVRLAGRLGAAESRVLLLWWLRVETLLVTLQPDTATTNFARKAAKKLLKRPEHRGNPSLFLEFAILEATIAQDPQVAVKMLKALIEASHNLGPVLSRSDRTSHLAVYLTVAELWASQGSWNQVSSLLVSLVDHKMTGSSVDVARALKTFQQVTDDTIATQDGDTELTLLDIMSGDFLTLWVSSHCWLLVSVDNVWTAGAMLENTISRLKGGTTKSRLSYQRENLFCKYISILELRGRTHPGGTALLRQILNRALSEFPENSSLLAVQANLTIPIGKDTKLFQMEQLLGNIVRVIALEHRVKLHEIAESGEEDQKCSPRVVAQYERLVQHFESRHCPLVWRLYLRYVGSRATPGMIKSIFYKALEDCPWVRALYLQGASLLPEELSNIQDLLVEKELRLHVAPEELEILRK